MYQLFDGVSKKVCHGLVGKSGPELATHFPDTLSGGLYNPLGQGLALSQGLLCQMKIGDGISYGLGLDDLSIFIKDRLIRSPLPHYLPSVRCDLMDVGDLEFLRVEGLEGFYNRIHILFLYKLQEGLATNLLPALLKLTYVGVIQEG